MSLAETGKDHSSNQQNSSTHPYDVASTAQMPTPNQVNLLIQYHISHDKSFEPQLGYIEYLICMVLLESRPRAV